MFTKIINFIKGHALIHREFNSFLEEIDTDLTGLLYYAEVRWLSKGKMAAILFKNTRIDSIFLSDWVILTNFLT